MPGITIDVPALLRGLGTSGLIYAAKLVLDSRSGSAEASRGTAALPICIKSRGLTVDVVELLYSLEQEELLAAVQAAVEPYPALQKWRVVQELGDLVPTRASGSSSVGSTATKLPVIDHDGQRHQSATESSVGSTATKLPVIEHDGDRHCVEPAPNSGRKPPRLPGTSSGGRGTIGTQSTPSLPTIPRQGEIALTATERDARLLSERLRRAIRSKDFPSTQALLAARADIEQRDRDGSNATSLAMLQGTPHNILRVLLEARAQVHEVDTQGRSLAHLWAWSLPKTKSGVREAQKKLTLLVKSKANLNTKLPVTGDTPLHILARVFNTLSKRAADGQAPPGDEEMGNQKDTEAFATCTLSRMHLISASGASISALNGEGKRPISLISPRFHHLMMPLTQAATGADKHCILESGGEPKVSLPGKSPGVKMLIVDQNAGDACLE